MELFQRILSKDEITARFCRAAEAVLAKKLVNSKTDLAESLGVKPAKFSEILNGRMKVGIDMVAIMCDFYKVSPEWLLMSRGSNIFRATEDLPKIWVDDEDLTMNLPNSKRETSSASNTSYDVSPLMQLIREKDNTIREQAEQIGAMRARIQQLEAEKNDGLLCPHISPKIMETVSTD